MRSHDHRDLVLFKELVNDVGTIAHDVILLLRVSDSVLLHAKDLVRGSGVAPHKVHTHLLDSVCDASKVDSERTLDLVNVFQLDN